MHFTHLLLPRLHSDEPKQTAAAVSTTCMSLAKFAHKYNVKALGLECESFLVTKAQASGDIIQYP